MGFAIVGCGEVAGKHALAIREVGHTLTAVCEINPKSDFPLKHWIPPSRIYTEFNDFLDNIPDIDVVSICTPNYLHVPMAVALLNRGKKVILEKPIAAYLDDVDPLLEHPYVDNVAVCYQRRWNRQCRDIKDYANRHKITMILAEVLVRRDPPYWATWRSDLDKSGGGNLKNIDIHYFDLIQWWAGKEYKINFSKLAYSGEVDQVVYAELDFAGTQVSFLGSSVHSKRAISIQVFFDDGTEMVYDTDDATHTNVYRDFLYDGTKVGVNEALTSLKIVTDIYKAEH